MFTINIDNRNYKVKEDQNLLQACLSLGFNIPYFCWHPAMHSVGACRQCAVKEFRDEKDTRGRIIMSCMTAVRDGMRISIEDPEARSFRKNIIELLMLNHPHDCPVCDEGGECHLQDMTVMTGHTYRRSRFKKRTHRNQDLGPFVAHEMNRCIQCYRCVRYYRDYAGGRDLDVFACHDHVYFGRQKDGVLQSEFSGNLVEICPTGVFTDKTFQHQYSRSWDLQTAPSVCVHCGVGCNTIPGERYGRLRRIRTRFNGEVNRYFLCDRGRYGYGFVNSEKRIPQPLTRGDRSEEAQLPVDRETALNRIMDILSQSRGVIGIGSPRASLESNFALRTLVGPEQFHIGMADQEAGLVSLIIDILQNGRLRSPSLREVEACDAVLVLGEDVTNTAPILALSLRQAARRKQVETAVEQHLPSWDDTAIRNATQDMEGEFFIAATYKTKLDDVARSSYYAAPDDIARLGFAVAHALNRDLPAVSGLDEKTMSLASEIARELGNARRPLIVSGTGCGSEKVIQAAANVAWALSGKDRAPYLGLVVPECNTMGLGLMGGGSFGQAQETVQEGSADTAIILENDLYRRMDRDKADKFLAGIKHIIVIDHIGTSTTLKAECVLPAATFAEADGTFVSSEGRAQRFYQVYVPEGDIQESWRWIRDIMALQGSAEGREWQDLDDVVTALSRALPDLAGIRDAAPRASFRAVDMKIPRKPHRYSGRTAMFADVTVFEPKPPKDPDSPLAYSMEGFSGKPPSPLIPRFWAPGWNSPQAINKFQSEVGGPLLGGDPGIRLLEAGQKHYPSFTIPAPFAPRQDQVLFVSGHHIFGSEEMSIHSQGIVELSPKPYVGLGKKALDQSGLREGDTVTIRVNGASFRLPSRLVPDLPEDVGVLPVGLPGLFIDLPAWGTLSAAPSPEVKR